MTDAHCHVSCGDPAVRELLVGRDFFGVHPWATLNETAETSFSIVPDIQFLSALRAKLLANPTAGVGEIGLDRLKCRDILPRMREVFEAQLALAIELNRPVVLHGAKCWGQVVAAVRAFSSRQPLIQTIKQSNNQTLPPLLFHGFSRSDGLISDIVKLNGFISVGPAVLNDHAVNYRELVKKIPLDRLLVETDRTEANATDCPSVRDVLAKVAELRGISAAELEKITDENVEKFFGASL